MSTTTIHPMPVHPKLLEQYQKAGFEWHPSAYEKAFKLWYERVSDNESDTKQSKPNSPIVEQVLSLVRIQDMDKNEWLAYSCWWIGRDGLDNELTFSSGGRGLLNTYPDVKFRKVRFFDEKTQRFKDRIVDITSQTTAYEVKFSPKAAEELLKKGIHGRPMPMTVYRDYTAGLGNKLYPIAVHSFDDFCNKPFDELCRIKKYDDGAAPDSGAAGTAKK